MALANDRGGGNGLAFAVGDQWRPTSPCVCRAICSSSSEGSTRTWQLESSLLIGLASARLRASSSRTPSEDNPVCPAVGSDTRAKDRRVEPERGGVLRMALPHGLIRRRWLMTAAGHVMRRPPGRRRMPRTLPDRTVKAVKALACSWFSAWPTGLLQWLSPEAAALHEDQLARFSSRGRCH